MYGDELPEGWQIDRFRTEEDRLQRVSIAGPGGLAERYLDIHWQTGTIPEGGPNGVQLEHVIQLCVERLQELNQPPFNSRENSLAITHLQEAQHWLYARTRDRQQRGVEGKLEP